MIEKYLYVKDKKVCVTVCTDNLYGIGNKHFYVNSKRAFACKKVFVC